MAAGYGSLALVAWAYRRLREQEGLGGGDPKMFGALGAWLGWQPLPWVLVLAAGVGLIAVAMVAARGTTTAGTMRLPLGALMAAPAWGLWLADRIG